MQLPHFLPVCQISCQPPTAAAATTAASPNCCTPAGAQMTLSGCVLRTYLAVPTHKEMGTHWEEIGHQAPGVNPGSQTHLPGPPAPLVVLCEAQGGSLSHQAPLFVCVGQHGDSPGRPWKMTVSLGPLPLGSLGSPPAQPHCPMHSTSPHTPEPAAPPRKDSNKVTLMSLISRHC